MSNLFIMTPLEWLPADHGPEEIRETSAMLRMTVNNRLLTAINNDWTKTVDDAVRLSAYPLALWFASSWWRLCWEPAPVEKEEPHVEWCMAHEMGSAGQGFLWPPVRFESDGETIVIHGTPSPAKSAEPIRYLNQLREPVPLANFIEGIADFIQTVIRRLDSVGVRNTDLHTLWQEVSDERRDSEATTYRKLEALSGFDPDEAPETHVDALMKLCTDVGEAAIAEIAAAHSDTTTLLDKVKGEAGVPGSLSAIASLREAHPPYTAATPWDRGWNLAQTVREKLGLSSKPVSDRQLGEILEVTEQELISDSAPMAKTRVSLAVKAEDGDHTNFLFRRKSPNGRRFEVGRWIADAMLPTTQKDRWLPATDTKTARQKMQRAFAAEFLAPAGALQTFLNDDLTDEDRIEEAGKHFRVSSWTIQSQLVNHGLVSPDAIGIDPRIHAR